MAITLKQKTGTVDLTTRIQAVKGDDGGYYIPAVDADGNLTWTGSEAGMAPVEGANIKGIPGQDGKDGAPGRDGKDGAPGKDGINGKDGAPGKDGKDGINGTNGKDGIDGKDGESGVYVGSTEPTDPEALIWINPEGGVSEALATQSYVDNAITEALNGIANAEDGAY